MFELASTFRDCALAVLCPQPSTTNSTWLTCSSKHFRPICDVDLAYFKNACVAVSSATKVAKVISSLQQGCRCTRLQFKTHLGFVVSPPGGSTVDGYSRSTVEPGTREDHLRLACSSGIMIVNPYVLKAKSFNCDFGTPLPWLAWLPR